MHSGPKASIGFGKQLLTCAIMCALAVVVILLFHHRPYLPRLLSGLPLLQQAIVGVTLGGLYCLSAVLGHKYVTGRKAAKTIIEGYSRLDLSGWNPLWIALAAGFGEELLFRGALQPVLGIWATSGLFVLAHVKAYRFNALSKGVLIQAISIFAISVCFGYVAQYVGLVAAMIIHAAMDVAGLYAIRRVAHVPATAA
ncbi:hypothetical protein GCM10027431_13870 [Lysobacter rhizosphaerae]